MKILVYPTSSTPFFFRELIPFARKKGHTIDWRMMILSWRHRTLFKGILPDEHTFYVHGAVNARMKHPFPDVSVFKTYPGSLAKDIAVDKNIFGQVRRYPKAYQLKSAIAFYEVYKEYLLREKPDVIFCPGLESHDGMIFYAVARELGIRTVFVNASRLFSTYFFSATPYEDLPAYAMTEQPSESILKQARDIVDQFEQKPLKPFAFNVEPKPEDIIHFPKLQPMRKKLWKIPKALVGYAKDVWLEPHSARPHPLWFQPYMQFWWLGNRMARVKAGLRRRYNDIRTLSELPQRFFYFPLHVSPEVSITTLAPYFEDQLRAIDLIRYSMPADYLLVVKEHPYMQGRRPVKFLKTLSHMAGVQIASLDIPSLQLIRRAALTFAVTGTAALEAMILGCPSLLLGEAFFAPWVRRFDSFLHFDQTIQEAKTQDRAAIKARGVDCVARTLSSSYDFWFYDPHTPDWDPKYMMNWRNVDQFLNGLLDHLKRLNPK
jgi:hypothetical protein